MSEPVLAEKQKEPEAQTLYSKSCAMVDGDSGRLLYGKEAQTALPNASTTKILTCIVAMEQCKPDEVVTFSAKAASQPKVHLGAKKGEQFYMQDLWYGLMLESYNDCAYAIAEHVAGSAEKFAAFLNTLFYMSSLILLFGRTDIILSYRETLAPGKNVFLFVCAFVGINAIAEWVSSTLVTGAVGAALTKAKLVPAPKAKLVAAE